MSADGKTWLTTADLAARWRVSVKTVRSWRFRRTGPRYFKPAGPRGAARYDLEDIIAWEAGNRRSAA